MTFEGLALLPLIDDQFAVIILVHIFIFDELLSIQNISGSIPTVATNLKNKNNKRYL
jgi:hypothetical protein